MQVRSVVFLTSVVTLIILGVALTLTLGSSTSAKTHTPPHAAGMSDTKDLASKHNKEKSESQRPPSTPETSATQLRPSVTTENPTLRTFVDTAASPRFGSDFHSLVPTISDPNDIAWVIFVLRDHADLDAVRNEAANLLRRSYVPDVDRLLLDILASPLEKARFQSYAVQHLGDMAREFREGTKPEDMNRARAIHSALVNALKSPHFMVRSEALMALARERDPRAAEIIRKGLADPDWTEGQDLLIRCAKEAGLTDLAPTIRPLAYSTNDVVRIAAVNVLAEWRDEASRPAFEEASRSTVPRLQRAGALALSLMDQPK